MIKYLGSKRTLLSTIEQIMQIIPNNRSVIDLFSGTSRVGHHLKGAGYQVLSNDLNTYAFALATCYVQANRDAHAEAITDILSSMEELDPLPDTSSNSPRTHNCNPQWCESRCHA